MDKSNALSPQHDSAPTSLGKYITMARRALDDGNFPDAKRFYEMALFEDTENIEASFYMTFLGVFIETTQANVSMHIEILKDRVEKCLISLKNGSNDEKNDMLERMYAALSLFSNNCIKTFFNSSAKKDALSLLAHCATSALLHLGNDGLKFATDLLDARLITIRYNEIYSSSELAEEYNFHEELFSKFSDSGKVPDTTIALLTLIGKGEKNLALLKSLPKSKNRDEYIAEIEKELEEKRLKNQKLYEELKAQRKAYIIKWSIVFVVAVVAIVACAIAVGSFLMS